MNIRNRDRLEKKDDRKAFEGKDNCENICATTERRRDERRRRPSPFGASARKKMSTGVPRLSGRFARTAEGARPLRAPTKARQWQSPKSPKSRYM